MGDRVRRVVPLTTGIGAHRRPRKAALTAQTSGLTVHYQHDGGWLTREHVITVEGERATVMAWLNDVHRLVTMLRCPDE
mgnify:CR=1 FL=1